MNIPLKKHVVSAIFVASSALFFSQTTEASRTLKYLEKANERIAESNGDLDKMLSAVKYLIKGYDSLDDAIIKHLEECPEDWNTKKSSKGHKKSHSKKSKSSSRHGSPHEYIYSFYRESGFFYRGNITVSPRINFVAWKSGSIDSEDKWVSYHNKTFNSVFEKIREDEFLKTRVVQNPEDGRYYVLSGKDERHWVFFFRYGANETSVDDFLSSGCCGPAFDELSRTDSAGSESRVFELYRYNDFCEMKQKEDVQSSFNKYVEEAIFESLEVSKLKKAHSVFVSEFVVPSSTIIKKICDHLHKHGVSEASFELVERLLSLYKRYTECGLAWSGARVSDSNDFESRRDAIHNLLVDLVTSDAIGQGNVEFMKICSFLNGAFGEWESNAAERVGEFMGVEYRPIGYYQIEPALMSGKLALSAKKIGTVSFLNEELIQIFSSTLSTVAHVSHHCKKMLDDTIAREEMLGGHYKIVYNRPRAGGFLL